MQYWHRRRAHRPYSRVRTYAALKDAKLAGFAGYKVGMTHVIITDNRATTLTKGEQIAMPVTVIECPPLRIASARFYKINYDGLQVEAEVFAKPEKELTRKIGIKKDTTSRLDEISKNLDAYKEIRVNVYTQPKLAGVDKKTPEFFEIGLGGTVKEQFDFVKANLGREIGVEDVFREGQQLDIHAVTKGKGFQGPVKRFGVQIRSHKAEKTVRGPGNLGPWTGNRSWTVAHAGQMGFHNRFEHNKWLLKINHDAKTVNPSGGFLHYGNVKSSYILVKGSIGGSAKRLIRLTHAIRKSKKIPAEAAKVEQISLASKQRR